MVKTWRKPFGPQRIKCARNNTDAAELRLQFAQSNELQNRIQENLAKIGIDL